MLRTLAWLVIWLFVSPHAGAESTCPDRDPRANKRYVTTDLNLRAWPSTGADILVTLPEGEIVYQYRTEETWSAVNVASLNVTGYVANRYLSSDCIAGGGLSRDSLPRTSIVTILMRQSLARYSGSCPCPYNVDRGGRRCGGRSAYSRPGGASPLCYRGDVSDAMINQFRASR